MSNNVLYWLWLQNALGAGAELREAIEYFGGAKGIYDADEYSLKFSGIFNPNQVLALCNKSLGKAEDIQSLCKLHGWSIIDFEDADYPQRLADIANPPAVLYVDGNLPSVDDNLFISIVGARKASDYAVKAAEIMSRGVAEHGAVVVSGGALGVDSAAHNGAILCGGKTVAVLGCGFGVNYLMFNQPLRDAIRNNGALITEFPPFTPASKYTFPIRNRIISGISLAVLVVEAGVKSGSLITARYAMEQGREVFAIPCSILEDAFSGTNRLIDDGASVATKPLDLLYPFARQFGINIGKVKSVSQLMKAKPKREANFASDESKRYFFENNSESRSLRGKRQNAAASLSGDNLAVYNVLTQELMHIDEITEKAKLPLGSVLAALTTLELMDLAQSAGGKRYKLS